MRDNIDDASQTGIYFLVNATLAADGYVPIYVGQAGAGIQRVMQHMDTEKSFTHVVLITGTHAGVFDAASIAYLERVFIEDVFSAASQGYRTAPLNKVVPSMGTVRDSDRHVYDEYAGVIKWYIEHLGYDYAGDALHAGPALQVERPAMELPPVSVPESCVSMTAPDNFEYIAPASVLNPEYILKRKGARNVRGGHDPESGLFFVFAGAEIRRECMKRASRKVMTARETLIDNGFVSVMDDHLVFDVDVAFPSARIAADVAAGGRVGDSAWVAYKENAMV